MMIQIVKKAALGYAIVTTSVGAGLGGKEAYNNTKFRQTWNGKKNNGELCINTAKGAVQGAILGPILVPKQLYNGIFF
jgi:hypothetical protein